MSTPGQNLLLRAFRLIAQQPVTYFQFTGRTLNAVGQDVASYAPGVDITGSVQAIPKNLYEQYGLDLTKTYVMFYVSKDVLTTNRDVSGDHIIFNTKTYQCESETDWFAMDG